MQMRAFFIECSGRHWIATARALSEGHGIAPVLWTANRETVGEVSKIFPGIVAQVGVDASCGRFE